MGPRRKRSSGCTTTHRTSGGFQRPWRGASAMCSSSWCTLPYPLPVAIQPPSRVRACWGAASHPRHPAHSLHGSLPAGLENHSDSSGLGLRFKPTGRGRAAAPGGRLRRGPGRQVGGARGRRGAPAAPARRQVRALNFFGQGRVYPFTATRCACALGSIPGSQSLRSLRRFLRQGRTPPPCKVWHE